MVICTTHAVQFFEAPSKAAHVLLVFVFYPYFCVFLPFLNALLMLKNPLATQSRVHFRKGKHLFSHDKASALLCRTNFQNQLWRVYKGKKSLSLTRLKASHKPSNCCSNLCELTFMPDCRHTLPPITSTCSAITRTGWDYLHSVDRCQQTHTNSTWDPKHQKNDQRNLSVYYKLDLPQVQTKTLEEIWTYGITLPSMANSHGKHFWR